MLCAAGHNKKMHQQQQQPAAAATADANADTNAADHLEEDEHAFEG